jgi:hypothetical protein
MNQPVVAPPPNEVTNFPVDHDWLALAEVEEAIDPDLPIVDCHHHLFDRPESRYLVPDLMRDIGDGHNVIGTVNVEAAIISSALMGRSICGRSARPRSSPG